MKKNTKDLPSVAYITQSDLSLISEAAIEYFSGYYDISVIIINPSKNPKRAKRINASNNVIYINKFKKNIYGVSKIISFVYVIKLSFLLKKYKFRLCYISLINYAFLIKLINPKTVYLFCGQHPAVSGNTFYDFFWNFNMFINFKVYDNIIITNKSSMIKYKPKINKVLLINPFTVKYSQVEKKFEALRLLYVGTLNGREIDKTIQGFNQFYQEYKDKIKIKYTIIGTGSTDNVKKLTDQIDLYKTCNVEFLGYLDNKEVQPFFDNCNIGIGYCPIVDHYTNNYSFKVIEYLLCGMAVIATATNCNKELINQHNGVLTEDNSNSFYNGLVAIYKNLQNYNSKKISDDAKKYDRYYVYENQLKPILENFIYKT